MAKRHAKWFAHLVARETVSGFAMLKGSWSETSCKAPMPKRQPDLTPVWFPELDEYVAERGSSELDHSVAEKDIPLHA